MTNLFDIKGKVVLITGGCGVIGESLALYLAEQGARVVILARRDAEGHALEERLNVVGEGLYLRSDVMDEALLRQNCEDILARYGRIDSLINAAGGNMPGATIAPDQTFMDIDTEDMRRVVDLNLFGTVLPTRVFGEVMCRQGEGTIVNFCSETALRPLTRVMGYSSAKAAIANYTRFMATEMATKFSPRIRVNAIVPGFLVTKQNRTLLLNEDGTPTERGRSIMAHTPMHRFSVPEELHGTIHYLISEASSFVTGALSVVDGGFDAFSI